MAHIASKLLQAHRLCRHRDDLGHPWYKKKPQLSKLNKCSKKDTVYSIKQILNHMNMNKINIKPQIRKPLMSHAASWIYSILVDFAVTNVENFWSTMVPHPPP